MAQAMWGDSSSDSEERSSKNYAWASTKDEQFGLVAKSDGDDDKYVTLLDIKKNLKYYFLKKIKFLTNVLIDDVCDLT